MSLILSCLLAFGSTTEFAPRAPTISWSPDGRWVAYLQADGAVWKRLEPGWIFGDPIIERPAETPISRIWVTRVETRESAPLVESKLPISSPAWRPDGLAIAFARVLEDGPKRWRFDVVIHEGPDRERVIFSRPATHSPGDAVRLAGQAPAWSADGRYLVFSQGIGLGLCVARAGDGRIVKTLEGAFSPGWSPDGRLAYFRTGSPPTLHWLDAHLGEPRRVGEVFGAESGPPPLWSKDGLSLLYVARVPPGTPRAKLGDGTALMVASTETGQSREELKSILHENLRQTTPAFDVTLALDRDGEHLFYTTRAEKAPSQITLYRPRTKDRPIRFHPLDPIMPITSLSVSPSGTSLAMRLGIPGRWSPPGLCDLNDQHLDPLVPDDSARGDWIVTIVLATRDLILAYHPADGRPAPARPTLLPFPEEFSPKEEREDYLGPKLRKLAAFGRTLCDRPSDVPPAEPALLSLIAEARLFFDALLDDFPAVRPALPTLESLANTPDRRERLLGLCAQIDSSLGDPAQAKVTLDYLKKTSVSMARVIEETASRPVLAPPSQGAGWITCLSQWIAAGNKPPTTSKTRPSPFERRGTGTQRMVPQLEMPHERFELQIRPF